MSTKVYAQIKREYAILYTQMWRVQNPEKYKELKRKDIAIKAQRMKTDPNFRNRQYKYAEKYRKKNELAFYLYEAFRYLSQKEDR